MLRSPPTTTPIFRHAPARRSQRRGAFVLQRRRTPPSQPRCRSQLWPAHGKIPIAERAAPPNTCPFPRFRPLEVFGRRPRCVGKCSWRPASEKLLIFRRRTLSPLTAAYPPIASWLGGCCCLPILAQYCPCSRHSSTFIAITVPALTS